MSLDRCPDRVLQQLREDVVERHFDVRKPGADVTGNPDVRGVTVLVLGQVFDERRPAFDEALGAHGDVDDSNVIILKNVSTKLINNIRLSFS